MPRFPTAYRLSFALLAATVAFSAADPAAAAMSDDKISCRVFNNGYRAPSAFKDSVYFRDDSQVCVPDGTAAGTCRKWFGRCKVNRTGEAVFFRVFNDGYKTMSLASDAVYFRSARSSCVPDGSATGTCRKWAGRGLTKFAGKPVVCYLFDDGYKHMVGPTDAFYIKGARSVCMPDGTASGTCRKWFGRCKVK